MAEVALIVIFILVFFAIGFTVGVLIAGMIGRWMNGRPRGGANRKPDADRN
jgi:hypothetical protein